MLGMQANLEIARRALRAQQLAMSVIGANIANVNTLGYSRRRVDLAASRDVMTAGGVVGAGVDVRGVSRGRDVLLDRMYRDHSSGAGKWAALQESLAKVESLFPASDQGGLGSALGAFWSSWNDLAKDPASPAARVGVRARGQELTEIFHRLDTEIAAQTADVDTQIASGVDRINQIAERLAALNDGIGASELRGQEASGLRDERDLLLEELSEIATVHTEETPTGSVTVTLGSEVLVQENRHRQLGLVSEANGRTQSPVLRWTDTGREPVIAGGRLQGYVVARDQRLAGYRATLDALAATLVAEVNRVHAAGHGLDGSTNNQFFDPQKVRAADIALDAGVGANLDRIAASASGAPGDGDAALGIARLRTATPMSGGRETLEGFYRSLVGRIGLDAGQASAFSDAEFGALDEIDAQRAAVSGVSLDEEMTQLLSAQHAYEAMIRVTSAIGDMMDKLVSSI